MKAQRTRSLLKFPKCLKKNLFFAKSVRVPSFCDSPRCLALISSVICNLVCLLWSPLVTGGPCPWVYLPLCIPFEDSFKFYPVGQWAVELPPVVFLAVHSCVFTGPFVFLLFSPFCFVILFLFFFCLSYFLSPLSVHLHGTWGGGMCIVHARVSVCLSVHGVFYAFCL